MSKEKKIFSVLKDSKVLVQSSRKDSIVEYDLNEVFFFKRKYIDMEF